MPLNNYKCSVCDEVSALLHTDELVCEICGSEEITKLLPIPNKNVNTNRGDKYHNKHAPENIREILMKRSKEHSMKTLPETIDKFGERIAREKGWIDKNGKPKTMWDEK